MGQSVLYFTDAGVGWEIRGQTTGAPSHRALLELIELDVDNGRSPIRINRDYLAYANDFKQANGRVALVNDAHAGLIRAGSDRADARRKYLQRVPGTTFEMDLFAPNKTGVGHPFQDPMTALLRGYLYLGLILERAREGYDVTTPSHNWEFVEDDLYPGYQGRRLFELNHNPVKDFYVLMKKVNLSTANALNDYVGKPKEEFGSDTAQPFWQLRTSYQRWFWFFLAEGLIWLDFDSGQRVIARLTDEGFTAYDLFGCYFGFPEDRGRIERSLT